MAVADPVTSVSPNADSTVVSCTVTRDRDRPARHGDGPGDCAVPDRTVSAAERAAAGSAARLVGLAGVQRRRGQRVRAGAGGLLGQVRGVLAGVDRVAAVHDQPGQSPAARP